MIWSRGRGRVDWSWSWSWSRVCRSWSWSWIGRSWSWVGRSHVVRDDYWSRVDGVVKQGSSVVDHGMVRLVNSVSHHREVVTMMDHVRGDVGSGCGDTQTNQSTNNKSLQGKV